MYSRYYLFPVGESLNERGMLALSNFLKNCEYREMSSTTFSISDDVEIKVYKTIKSKDTCLAVDYTGFDGSGDTLVQCSSNLTADVILKHMRRFKKNDDVGYNSPFVCYHYHLYSDERCNAKRSLQRFIEKHETRNRCTRRIELGKDDSVNMYFAHMRLNIRGVYQRKYVEHLGYNVLGDVLVQHTKDLKSDDLEKTLKDSAELQKEQLKEFPTETRYSVELVQNHLTRLDAKTLKQVHSKQLRRRGVKRPTNNVVKIEKVRKIDGQEDDQQDEVADYGP